MKGTQGSGSSIVEGYPEKKHIFTRDIEKVPLLYNIYRVDPRKVIKIDPLTNKTLKIYKSITEAANDVDRSRKVIHLCLSGIQKTAGGFKWEYLK